jgi:hypothetical protein
MKYSCQKKIDNHRRQHHISTHFLEIHHLSTLQEKKKPSNASLKNVKRSISIDTPRQSQHSICCTQISHSLRLCLLTSSVMAAAQPHTADVKSATSSLLRVSEILPGCHARPYRTWHVPFWAPRSSTCWCCTCPAQVPPRRSNRRLEYDNAMYLFAPDFEY